MPGSIHSPFAKGCHKLIKEGAKLVETAQDVLEELRMTPAPAATSRGTTPDAAEADLTPDERAVACALAHAAAGIDTLAQRSGLAPEAVAAALLALELDGLVSPLPGGLWQHRG